MLEPFWRRPVYILICATAVVMISVGIRQSFGLFLKPITLELGWEFGVFASAIAIQNLMIGIGAPLLGAVADRWGKVRVMVCAGACFALGIYLISQSTTQGGMILSGGFLAGNVGGRSPVNLDVKPEVRSENPIAQQIRFTQFLQRRFGGLDLFGHVLDEVDVSKICPGRESTEQHPLQYLVRIAGDQELVLFTARLMLAAIGDYKLLVGVGIGRQAPLGSDGKGRPSTAAQAGVFQELDEGLRRAIRERLFDGHVTVLGAVLVEALAGCVSGPRQEYPGLITHRPQA